MEGSDPSNFAEPKRCFVICPIGPSGSDIRRRSDQIYKHIIGTTLEPLGYTLNRADLIEQTGQITTQIIETIINADLVVADLTDHNPNVFYELALRHALAKPFIHLISSDQKLPFDIQTLRTIFFDHTDLDSVHDAKKSLEGMVSAIEKGEPVETPMTVTLNLQSLRQSEDSEARGIAELHAEIASIKSSILRLNSSPKSDRDLIALRKFIEILSRDGRLTVDDREVLVDSRHISPSLHRWFSKLEWRTNTVYSDEPPF